MASADTKDLYIPLSPIRGKKNSDGTYTLTALDIKNLNDNLYAIAKKIQGGLSLSDLLSDAVNVLVTTDGLTIKAANGSSSSTVKIMVNGVEVSSANISFTGMVTFSDLAGSGKTTINGDNITTGTLKGVTIVSDNGTRQVTVDDGEISFWYKTASSIWEVGRLFSYDGESVMLTADSGNVLKISSGGNMSIDSDDGTVYIGTTTGTTGNVTIGKSGGTVNLRGDVYLNGEPLTTGTSA